MDSNRTKLLEISDLILFCTQKSQEEKIFNKTFISPAMIPVYNYFLGSNHGSCNVHKI